MKVDPTDLIWMNGEFVAWEDAKVHVLTHGLHYGTGVFEGVRCYDTELGPAVFRNAEHVERLFRSAELYYMEIPYTRRAAARGDARAGRAQRPALVLHPPDRLPRLRLDGPEPAGRLRRRDDRLLGVGRVPRRGGRQQRRAREGLLVAADQPRLADPAREGLGPVPQQRAGEGRGGQVRLRRGDPARRSRLRLRGHRREHLRRARRRDRHAWPEQLDPRRDHAPLGDPDRADLGYTVVERDIARAEMYLADEVFMSGTAAELVPVREVDDHPVGTGKPGEITRVLQAAFDDAIHGRSERYREWLDVVDASALETPTGEAPSAERHGRRLRPGDGRHTAIRRHPARRDGRRRPDADRRGEAARRARARRARRGHDRGRLSRVQPEGAAAVRAARRRDAGHGRDRRLRDDAPARALRPRTTRACACWPTASRRSARSSARPRCCTSRRSCASRARRTWR